MRQGQPYLVMARHPTTTLNARGSTGVSPPVMTAERNAATGQRGTLTSRTEMIRKLASGEYRLYSTKKDPKTGRRKNLGTFKTRAAAEKHERAVQYFKRRG